MSDDIVTRLRESTTNEYFITDRVMLEAADEIERLRQSEFMWKMTAVKIATKLLPLSLLLSEQEKEELQIIIEEAAK